MNNDALISIVKDALSKVAKAHGAQGGEVPAPVIPPDIKMGDIGFPMFTLAKSFHASPVVIANETAEVLKAVTSSGDSEDGTDGAAIKTNSSDETNSGKVRYEFLAVGPYLNVRLDRKSVTESVLASIEENGADWGRGKRNERVMVEFSCPNTNKPLHLGHLRNDALGESLSRILAFAGATVQKVDLINDRGVHICKSMLAYKMNHEEKGDTPETLGIKGDHFVGRCYVEYAKAEKDNPSLAREAEDMLVKWEAGDKDVCALWERMNKWTIDGIEETYKRTGVSFDKVYYESKTYLLGKDEVQKGLDRGAFFRAADGSVRCDITKAVGNSRNGAAQEKVLLRADGTSVYITQDIGTAIMRHNEWPYNKMIYVVAAEQSYHFKALFYILKQLGYEWADSLVHLSYGLVNLPEGRMKSREGTVVDADDLIDSLAADAYEAIKMRQKSADENASEEGGSRYLSAVHEADGVSATQGTAANDDIAQKVALGALHYYLLSATPNKDMLFDPKKSLSFVGDTGPYLQYMGARITSILRKAGEADAAKAENAHNARVKEASALVTGEAEWQLVRALDAWPDAVEKAANTCDPSVVALWLKGCAKAFSKFYDECPILQANEDIKRARLLLVRSTLTVMKRAMELIMVPYLERM